MSGSMMIILPAPVAARVRPSPATTVRWNGLAGMRFTIVSAGRLRLRWLLTMALIGGVPQAAGARRAAVTEPSMPLDAMTFRDAASAGAVGTGCTWLGGPGRARRLSMADDRAVVRRNGAVVAMRPAPGAKALFFTYDRWAGGDMDILVRDTGKVVRRGGESSETIAWLDLTASGRTRSFRGHLNCGS